MTRYIENSHYSAMTFMWHLLARIGQQILRHCVMDKITTEQRSANMARIRNRDTKLEVYIRKQLFLRGFRFRKNVGTLPGRPDIVFPRYRAIIQVHGCFWHGHLDCKNFRIPKSNVEFWSEKISKNQERDKKTEELLKQSNWRVRVVWECELENIPKEKHTEFFDSLASWLRETHALKMRCF